MTATTECSECKRLSKINGNYCSIECANKGGYFSK